MTKGEITKKRILDAATLEFSQHGFEGSRIARIAENAQTNKERIYANFKNKENLFSHVWRETYQLIVDEDQSFFSLKEEDIPKMGEIILKKYMEFHETHPLFWRIFAWKNLVSDGDNTVIEGLKSPVHNHLKKLYNRGQSLGTFKSDVSFETFIFTIISITFTFSSNRSTMSKTLGLDFNSREIKNNYIKECCKMLFN
ncbi:MAG: TetR/AcrR family transcriptional regulator [Spirochaetaceae bacterium]